MSQKSGVLEIVPNEFAVMQNMKTEQPLPLHLSHSSTTVVTT